ncbi:MAG: hypothetical protein IJE43_05855 [Alphaproteobacteria bacterium]|nr:hypothetical protein [Alphaproteobacteria bacterium]
MKKNVLLIIGGIFVVVTLIAMLLFIFFGNTPVLEQNAENIELEGTWKVVVSVEAGNNYLMDDEYIVFADDTANIYRDGASTPYATSKFELTSGATYSEHVMMLRDISCKYTVSVVTDNYIRLYESKDVYMELIRYAHEDKSELIFEETMLWGKWDVVYRNTAEVITNEQLEFVDGELRDYRNGATDPIITTSYTCENGNHLIIDALNTEIMCIPLSEDVIFFIEISTNCIWEIHKVS